MSRAFRVALAALVMPVSLVLAAQEQQTPPTFRTGVDVVQLDVTVLDENRQPVKGLTAADFTVVERGEPQPIVSFAAVDLPPRAVDGAAWVREVGPDVSTNFQDAQRVVVILLDDCNVPFDPMYAKIARRIADDTIEHLGPADLAAVVYTGSRRQGQEFTSDRTRLRAAVERFTPLGGTPPPGPFSASRGSSGGVSLGGPRSAMCYRSVPQALENAAESLRGYPGWRKTLAFISPYTPTFDPESIETADDLGVWGDVFDAMQEANLTLYQYDPRGLEPGVGLAPDLGTLADATGGRTMRATNAPEAGVPQMFRENSSYYVIGFQPLDERRNGRFRAIDVRVNRPGVTVRTRSGYFAPRDERPARRSNRPEPTVLDKAVSGALPSGDLPLSVTAAPFAVPGSRDAAVAVIAGFTPVGNVGGRDVFEVLATAFRDDWKSMGATTQRIEIPSRPSAEGPLHIDLASRLDLPPGRYEIRTAVTSVLTGRTGSAYASVVVPDFRRDDLALSGVALNRQPPAMTGGNAAVATIVPGTPTTMRAFAATDRLSAFVQVSQSERRPAAAVRMRLRVTDASDAVRATREVALDAAQFASARIADVSLDLPLEGLEPGEYLLTIDASSSRASTVERHVRFQVR